MSIVINPQYLAGTARQCILTECAVDLDGMQAKIGKKVCPFSDEYARTITTFALAKILDKCSGVDIILEDWFVRNLRNKWMAAVPAIVKRCLLELTAGSSSDVFAVVSTHVDETIRAVHHVEGYMTQQRISKQFVRGTYENVCEADFRQLHQWLTKHDTFDTSDIALLILARPFTGNRNSNLSETTRMEDHLHFVGLLRDPPKSHYRGCRMNLQGDRKFTYLFTK